MTIQSPYLDAELDRYLRDAHPEPCLCKDCGTDIAKPGLCRDCAKALADEFKADALREREDRA